MTTRQQYHRAYSLYRERRHLNDMRRQHLGMRADMAKLLSRADDDIQRELDTIPPAVRSAVFYEYYNRSWLPTTNKIGAWQLHSANTPISRLREVTVGKREYRCYWDGPRLRRRPLNSFEIQLERVS